MREISVAEFFEKNRHLLGFSNKRKAVVSCVKEAVDNSLDAAEEGRILPDIRIEIQDFGEDKIKLIVRDNATGIDRDHIPKVFGKLLYGSKFHKLQQNRGQQGIGISAAALYSQLTTGNPVRVISKRENGQAHLFEIHLDVKKNAPEIIRDETIDGFSRGTQVEMIMEGIYTRGQHSVFSYLKNTAIANPFANIILKEPDGNVIEFPRVSNQLPKRAREIKLHPHGVEFGILARLIKETNARTVKTFLMNEFTRVGDTSAREICRRAGLTGKEDPQSLPKEKIQDLLKAMHSANLQKPDLDCLSPIGEDLIIKGLKKELNPEFTVSITRPPSVYRGMPFQIEAAIAYGGDIKDEEHELLRFANKVPLLYNQSACVTAKAVKKTDWQRYGLKVSAEGIAGPAVILLHMCSVWVPYTSEGKEAISDYPEIFREMKLALQEVGRKLQLYLGKKFRMEAKEKKLKIFKAYSAEISKALSSMLGKSEEQTNKKFEELLKIKIGESGEEMQESEEIKEEERTSRIEEVIEGGESAEAS